jgi:hypothetical protein
MGMTTMGTTTMRTTTTRTTRTTTSTTEPALGHDHAMAGRRRKGRERDERLGPDHRPDSAAGRSGPRNADLLGQLKIAHRKDLSRPSPKAARPCWAGNGRPWNALLTGRAATPGFEKVRACFYYPALGIVRTARQLPPKTAVREGRFSPMREWRRSRINRAAHDLLPGWAGRPHSTWHSFVRRPSPAQPGGGRHTYVAKRGGCASGAVRDGGMTSTLPSHRQMTLGQPVTCGFGAGGGTRTPNLLFTRQQRTVHGVLARAVLAAHVGGVVQPVRSGRAE